MRTAKTIGELIGKRGEKGLPLERVYKILFHKNLYLQAYGKIYRNKGALTHGVTDETPDGMSLEKIDAIIEALRYERYQWLPVRRTSIPKKKGKKRPLGMPSMKDRAMQVLYLLALGPIAETTGDRNSYGFRPERSPADAIEQCFNVLSHNYSAHWVLEGDIK